MPWKETCAMEERLGFIRNWLKKEWSITRLCEMYNISRKTGYKWLERFKNEGLKGLGELSRRCHHHPNATLKEVEDKIISFRRKHRHWGPRKIIDRLEKREPEITWPAPSTAGSILKRKGLVLPRRLRRRVPLFEGLQQNVEQPNDVWATDFKGWFRTQDGRRVDPLTITDLASRFLLGCQAVKKTNWAEVRAQFEKVFREHGLPWRIRSDNGPPFASVGLGGLTRLSVWWIRLGILPERIRPGHPEDNPSHERMHRTLKQETAHPPAATYGGQQKRFDAFRHEFDTERPHESLGMQTPSERYRSSERLYPKRLPEIEYPADFSVRRVRSKGEIKLGGNLTYISQALIGEWVGLKRLDENTWNIHFGPLCLASFNSISKQLRRLNDISTSKKV
jgi:putative transposase